MKKNGNKSKSNGKKSSSTRSSDGRTFITVYVSSDEYSRIEAHVKKLKDKDALHRPIGMSSFMRAEAINAIERSDKR